MLLVSAALGALVYRGGYAAGQAAPGSGDSMVLGREELVELSAGGGADSGESRQVVAKVDTGAGYSSIDEDLAEELGIDVEGAEDEVEINSANGERDRPLVRVRIKVAGRTLDTRATVTDRDELSTEMLLGHRDLEGFLVKPDEERLTSPEGS